MHTIHPVTSTHSRPTTLRSLAAGADRIQVAGVAIMGLLTLLFAAVPSFYSPALGTVLALTFAAAILGTFPAVTRAFTENMLGGIYQDRRDVALLVLAVTVALAVWTGIEISTWD